MTVSTTNPMGLYAVSLAGYFWQIIFVIAFFVGFLSFKNDNSAKFTEPVLPILRSWFFYSVVSIGIVIVLSMYNFKSQVMALSEMDSAYIRKDFFEVMFAGNPFLLYTYYLFLYPLYFFLMSIVSFCILCRRNWKCILFCSMYLFPFMSLSEGRLAYMIFAIYLLFAFIVYKRIDGVSFHINKKVYGLGAVVLVGIYFFMASVTANRIGSDDLKDGANELNSTIVSYSVLPMRTFDYAINNNYMTKSGGPHWGRASLCGFDFLLSSFAKRIGVNYSSVRDDTNGLLQNNAVPVGSSSSANYSFTAAIYPYMDFGYWGIIVIPFLFGVFCKKQMQKLLKCFSIYSYALCGFLFFVVLHTPFSWYFNKLFTVPYIIFLIIMHKRQCLKRY